MAYYTVHAIQSLEKAGTGGLSVQLDHHPKGDEIQDYLKDITGKSSDAGLAFQSASPVECELVMLQ